MFSGALMPTPSILHVSVVLLRKNVMLLAAASVLANSIDVGIRANIATRRCDLRGVVGGIKSRGASRV